MVYTVKYPRRRLIRGLIRFVVRGLLKLLTRTEISGLEKFPAAGPLIVVGNHTGAMEVVLMGVFSPEPIEFMGAMDMPWNDWMGKIVHLYSIIPVYRGYTSPKTMKMGLDILAQGGMIGLFPEGGFWEPGNSQAQTGAAWLSYKSGAPILAVGFGDTRGLMAEAFRFNKPAIVMNVGKTLPPVELDGNLPKKEALQKAANQIMDAVWELVPEDEKARKSRQPEDEMFELLVKIFDQKGQQLDIPDELKISDGAWISRFIHRPNLINTIRDYIFKSIQILKELDRKPPTEEIYQAVQAMLDYVEQDNPQYFNYRYGYEDGEAFHNSFRQLRDLLAWAVEREFLVVATASYQYTDPENGKHKILVVPEEVEQW